MSLSKRLLLFDLDGTLIDSRISILNACKRALIIQSNLMPPDEKILDSIGIPMQDFLASYCKQEDIPQVISRFREFLIEETPHSTFVVEGVTEFLQLAKSTNVRMKVVTNKTSKIAIKVLSLMNLDSFFDEVIGIDMGKPKPSPELLLHAVRDWHGQGIPVMIGDRHEDLLAAYGAGLKCSLISENSVEGPERDALLQKVHAFSELDKYLLLGLG